MIFDASVAHQLLGESLLLCFRGGMFLFPRLISLHFCYDLDIWAQGQGLRSFFIGMCFVTIGQECKGGFSSNMTGSLTYQLHISYYGIHAQYF